MGCGEGRAANRCAKRDHTPARWCGHVFKDELQLNFLALQWTDNDFFKHPSVYRLERGQIILLNVADSLANKLQPSSFAGRASLQEVFVQQLKFSLRAAKFPLLVPQRHKLLAILVSECMGN